MTLPLARRFLALPLACFGVVILSSETRGYVLENKSWLEDCNGHHHANGIGSVVCRHSRMKQHLE